MADARKSKPSTPKSRAATSGTPKRGGTTGMYAKGTAKKTTTSGAKKYASGTDIPREVFRGSEWGKNRPVRRPAPAPTRRYGPPPAKDYTPKNAPAGSDVFSSDEWKMLGGRMQMSKLGGWTKEQQDYLDNNYDYFNPTYGKGTKASSRSSAKCKSCGKSKSSCKC